LRAQAIVQVAPETATFLFSGGYQALPRTLEVCRESHGVGGDPGLSGQTF
jgi:hypothetical protein